MQWPWRRFEAFYEAFQKRKLAEELVSRKMVYIGAILSNPNFDDEKVDKVKILEDIEAQFEGAIAQVYSGVYDEAEEADYDDPFFGAIKVPGEELMKESDGEKDKSFKPDDVEIDQVM